MRAASRLSIQTVLIGCFMLAAVLPIAFISVQRYVWVTRELLQAEVASDLAVARAVTVGLERYVGARRQLIDTLAAEFSARGLHDPGALSAELERARRRHRGFRTLLITDQTGTAIAFSPTLDPEGRPNVGKRFDDRAWFQRAVNSAPEPYELAFGRAQGGRPTVGVAAPIRSASGQVIAVVAGGLNLDELRESIRDADPAGAVRLVVVDSGGRVLVHSSPEWEAQGRDLSDEEVFRAARRSGEGTLEYTSSFTALRTWAAYVKVGATGWVVWAARGPEAREATIKGLLRDLIVSAAGALLVAGLAAVVVSRWLSSPIRLLADATRELAGRRFHEADRLLPQRGSRIGEFHQLTVGFREMADALSVQYEELEANVTERTRALAEQAREAQATSALLRAQEAIRRGYGELASLLNSLDRSYILEEGINKLAATLHAPLAAVYLTENGPESLRLKTYSALDATGLDTGLFSAAGLPVEIARRAEPVSLALSDSATQLSLQTGVGAVDVAAIAGYPLIYQKRLLGVLVVALLEPPSEATRTFLESAARQLSVALSNAGLFESVRYQSQQLEELNRELRRASDVKSQFLASMSHELRTPLNSIIGFTELLLASARDPLSDRQRTAMEKVLGSARHLLSLINDVLDLSKIEAGRMEARPERFAVAPLVRECLGAIEPQADAKRLAVRTVGLDAEPELVQDRGMVKQILLNLLANAVKFTEAGAVEVRVAAEPDEWLSLAVTDTGPGIRPEDRDAIFDAFRQGGSPRTQAAGGTGLGLAISRRLAELLGGSLSVESVPGSGSVFTLRLPIRYAHRLPQEAEASQHDLPPGTPRVLVVDDDRNVLDLVRGALDGEPVHVEWAPDASAGLAQARAHRPAVILLDVILQAGSDGWEVLEALKDDPATRDIPVLVHSVIDNPERARELGATGVLPKPASPAAVAARLRSFLGLVPAAGERAHRAPA